MGTGGTPTVPLLIAQGAGGELEGTSGDKPGIGKGDGVMIAGDVRTLARKYCHRGATVQYSQYDALAHVETAVPWIASAVPWLDRALRRPAGAAELRADRARQPADADRALTGPRETRYGPAS